MPGRQTVPRAELWRAIQTLSRVDEKSNIQIPMDAKYVTRGIAHRSRTEWVRSGTRRGDSREEPENRGSEASSHTAKNSGSTTSQGAAPV